MNNLHQSDQLTLPRRGVIAHEWIESVGGAEKVLDEFLALAPDADLVCLWNDTCEPRYAAARESWLAKTPLRGNKAAAVPAMSRTWRLTSLRGADWMLISSYVFAHHLASRRPERAFVYAHTPARFLWAPEVDPRASTRLSRFAKERLRSLDRRRVSRQAHYAANSDFVRRRIASAWGIRSSVIYPPVDVERLAGIESWCDRVVDERELRLLADLPNEFILGASRHVQYKRLDLVIEAGVAAGVPVVIGGAGPDTPRLRRIASHHQHPIHFVGRVSDELLFGLCQRALAFVFPPVEDFGILPVEAMAVGARVIANVTGGTSETIHDGQSGVLCGFDSRASLVDALDRVQHITRQSASLRASRFSATRFRRTIADWVNNGLRQ